MNSEKRYVPPITEAFEKHETYISPFEYRDDEHYYIEKIDKLSKKPFYSFVKRLFDICFSFTLLLILCVPMIIISIIIKCVSKGRVFYKQERLGLNGRKFNIVKFRTMNENAEKTGHNFRWETMIIESILSEDFSERRGLMSFLNFG